MKNNIKAVKIKNIIFDLDGTLIDSSAGVVEATNYALSSLGQNSRSPEEIKKYIGYPLDEMFPAFCDAPIKELKTAFQIQAAKSMVALSVALPGVDRLLSLFAAKNLKLAVATTKFKIHTEGIIAKFDWNRYLSVLVSGDEVERVKPAPDIVELALTRLGGQTDNTVMIGDTINDIISAHAAGLKAIAIRSPFGNDDLEQAQPDLLLDRLDDLKNVFNLKVL